MLDFLTGKAVARHFALKKLVEDYIAGRVQPLPPLPTGQAPVSVVHHRLPLKLKSQQLTGS